MPRDGQSGLDINQSISLSSLNQWSAVAPSFQLEMFCFRKCPLGLGGPMVTMSSAGCGLDPWMTS